MNDFCTLSVIGTLGELAYSQKCSKLLNIEIENVGTKIYNLYIYSPESCRVTAFQICFNDNINRNETEGFQLSSLKAFNLPCNVYELLSMNEKLWALTDENVINIKPYLECAVKENLRIKDRTSKDFMDVDFDNETFHVMQELNVRFPNFRKNNFQNKKFFVRNLLSKHHVVLCYEDIPTLTWNLQLVTSENGSHEFSSKYIPILNISLGAIINTGIFLTDQEMNERHFKPIVITIQPENILCPKFNSSRNNIFVKFFGVSLSSSSYICLVGFADGKVMWTAFSLSKKSAEGNAEFQFLYDLKQPITSIHFLEKIEKLEGYGFLLIIGAFGKVALLAAEKLFSNATVVETAKSTLFVVTSYLQVTVKESVLLSESILHVCQAGNVYASKFTIDNSEMKQLKCVSKKFDLCGIISLVIIDKGVGHILLRTKIGNLYLAKYQTVETQNDVVLSLPSIMAQCLHQSTVMKELISVQSLQRRFFGALAVFASLQHKEICFEEKFRCSASALSKKILLDISLQSLKQINLDSDLWSTAISVHSLFCENHKLISKTVPFSPDQPSLCIELDESELQPFSVSALPLLIEIGLILNIPEEWKVLDCFTLVEKSLPIYIRIQTFVIHELYFLKKNGSIPTISHNLISPRNILQTINEVAKKKPITNLLKPNIDVLTKVTEKFQFWFPISSIQEILDKNKETDPCHFVSQILQIKGVSDIPLNGESLSCRNIPVTITVEKIDSTILITLISKDIDLLLGIRMAALELLLSHQLSCETNPQMYVSIPGTINRKCEDMSVKLTSMCEKDSNSDEFWKEILLLYKELRQEISEKLPVI